MEMNQNVIWDKDGILSICITSNLSPSRALCRIAPSEKQRIPTHFILEETALHMRSYLVRCGSMLLGRTGGFCIRMKREGYGESKSNKVNR